jgi:hypothetical protein
MSTKAPRYPQVCVYELNRRKLVIQTTQQRIGSGRIPDIRSRHRDQQNQTENIGHDMAFSAICPLSAIVADLVPLVGSLDGLAIDTGHTRFCPMVSRLAHDIPKHTQHLVPKVLRDAINCNTS